MRHVIPNERGYGGTSNYMMDEYFLPLEDVIHAAQCASATNAFACVMYAPNNFLNFIIFILL